MNANMEVVRDSHLSKTVQALKHKMDVRRTFANRGKRTSDDYELSNEMVLEEVRRLFESTDKDMEKMAEDIAWLKGVICEMQRHNGKVIKMLVGLLATIVPAFCGFIAWLLMNGIGA